MERSPLQRLACQYGEPDFDLIEPGSAGLGKVEMDVLMLGQPAVAFRLMGVEIIKNDMDFATLIGLDDAVHEVEELDAPTAFVLAARDHARGNIKGGKQRRRAVALVVVRLAGERPPIGQFQVPLNPFQRLYEGFSSTASTSAFSGGAR